MPIERGAGRPHKGYRTTDGQRVPGVTTVLGRFKDSAGLIHWSWQCGIDGKDYRRVRDDAANAGTLAHDMIEAEIHGGAHEPAADVPEETVKLACRALNNFKRWASQTRLKIIATEVPLVSDTHLYGGTIDAIARVHGELSILDFKAANGIYAEYIAQVGAYGGLWRECRGQDVAGCHLLRVDKEVAGFHHHNWELPVLELGLRYFLLAREMYDLDKKLKKAV